MNKSKIEKLIQKYNLGGTIEAIKLVVKDEVLSAKFVSEDKTLLGLLSVKDFKFEDCEIGVFDTAKLKSLLGVLGDDVDLTLKKNEDVASALVLSDKTTDVNFMLADLSVIPNVPNLKSLPEFNVVIPLSKDFTSKFIKAKNALSEVDTFTLLQGKKSLSVVIGYSTINSNRISLDVEAEKGKDKISKAISFSAKYFREILLANADAKDAKLNVSDKGIAYVEFVDGEYTTRYYLVEIDTGAA